MEKSEHSVAERGFTRRSQEEQGRAGQEQRTDPIGMCCGQADRHPAAERMPDHDRWLRELVEDGEDQTGVTLRPDRVGRRR
jgi:hypothetical protein